AITAQGVNDNTTASAANVNVDTSGNLRKSTSSRRYKKAIEGYTRGLADVQKLRPVFYRSAAAGDDARLHAGLIAEEVAEAGLEEFVVRNAEGQPDALDYAHMVALLIKAVQELAAQK
ncbi:MAG TPA: tail fiber domain-containing protein, partial [Alphaproteobacteria bacterium]|nr:tail fiber domain-containing protein [Alphaproteobacteria bacterium]